MKRMTCSLLFVIIIIVSSISSKDILAGKDFPLPYSTDHWRFYYLDQVKFYPDQIMTQGTAIRLIPTKPLTGSSEDGKRNFLFSFYLEELSCESGIMPDILNSEPIFISQSGLSVHYLFKQVEGGNHFTFFGYRYNNFCLKMVFEQIAVPTKNFSKRPYLFTEDKNSDLSNLIKKIAKSPRFVEPYSKFSTIDVNNIDSIHLFSHKDSVKELLVNFDKNYNNSFIRALSNILYKINTKRLENAKEVIKLRVIGLHKENQKEIWPFYKDQKKIHPYLCPPMQDLENRGDLWMRDICKIASVKIKGLDKEKILVFDTNGGGIRKKLSIELSKQWKDALFLNIDNHKINGNSGGNIDVSPNDVLYVGNTSSPDFQSFWRDKGYKDRMVIMDSSWLKVGHVDEQVTTLVNPDPEDPCGIILVKADPKLALDILTKASKYSFQSFPRKFRTGKSLEMFQKIISLQEYLHAPASSSYRDNISQNEQFIRDNSKISKIINKNIKKLKTKIIEVSPTCKEIKIVSIPIIYDCNKSKYLTHECSSLLPNSINMTVLDQDLIVPHPLYSPFKKITEKNLKDQGQHPYFLKDVMYHQLSGDIHCGTNELRTK